tara:strand:+ start:424 stop:876 length:453 start_codon:yes stop_codon:yes gene_type:complete
MQANLSNISTADIEAVEFYQSQKWNVEAFGLLHLADREERRFYKRGRTILETAIETTVRAVRASERTWLAEEYDALAAAYVRHAGNRPAILKEFRLFSERHTDNAIDIAAQACRALDNQVKDAKGLKDYANGLLMALQSIDNERFTAIRS